jgi:transcriptional regulator with XRE-family HTH domain
LRKLLLDAMAAADPPLICQQVRHAREQAELSQEEAARRLHMSLGGYAAYERDREPKRSRLRQIAKAFELPEDHFERQEPATETAETIDEIDARLQALEARVADGLEVTLAAIQELAESVKRRDQLEPPRSAQPRTRR